MRVMVFVKATDDIEKGMPPTPEALEAFAAMDEFTEELVNAGVFIAAAGLKPSVEGKRIAFDGGSRTVIDGPFAETRELIAGFSIWEVKDMDEAMAWAKRCPPPPGKGEIEIRPFFEVADLGDFITPEELSTPRDGERGKLGVA
ncbi:MAG: YciI family protein [Steroidobacteraceae bacterium]|nr:YciI family protein [Steroidobacteraceae bacterium]